MASREIKVNGSGRRSNSNDCLYIISKPLTVQRRQRVNEALIEMALTLIGKMKQASQLYVPFYELHQYQA